MPMYEKPPLPPDFVSEKVAAIVPNAVGVLVEFQVSPTRARKSPTLVQFELNFAS